VLDSIQDILRHLFDPGDSSFDLSAWQMGLRAVLVYLFAIFVVRVGSKRFMGRNSAFDLLLGIMLGSVLSRGITGQAPLLGSMVAGGVLLLMHWLLGALACNLPGFGTLIKGRPRILVREGQVDEAAMTRSHIGRHDLQEALRTQGRCDDLEEVDLATLERNGNISIIPKKQPPRIVEVRVEEGVQTVRIELDG
jgi:uncharacterized membrane protein YcaP (DUF421 family)